MYSHPTYSGLRGLDVAKLLKHIPQQRGEPFPVEASGADPTVRTNLNVRWSGHLRSEEYLLGEGKFL
jgi:hypothetical protein